MTFLKKEWIFSAKVIKVVDADTIDFLVDLGFDISHQIRIRLLNVDGWEVTGVEKEKGKLATQFVKDLLSNYEIVNIKTYKEKGKYGRYLADVIFPDKDETLGEILIKNGHAVPYNSK